MLELDVSGLTDKDGVKNVISKLDTPFLEHTNKSAYAANENFEHVQGSSGMNMKDFINAVCEIPKIFERASPSNFRTQGSFTALNSRTIF